MYCVVPGGLMVMNISQTTLIDLDGWYGEIVGEYNQLTRTGPCC